MYVGRSDRSLMARASLAGEAEEESRFHALTKPQALEAKGTLATSRSSTKKKRKRK